MIPESIKKHRPKGTEIREKGGHYYVYKVKAYYDKDAKKSKRRSEGIIGQIYEGIGYVANSPALPPVITDKEFGSTWLVYSLTGEIRELLIQEFGSDALRIYTIALLKLIKGQARMKNIDLMYSASYISQLIPGLAFSKNAVPAFIEKISLQRDRMVEFFKALNSGIDHRIIFDGTSFTSSSSRNPYVMRGYNPHDMKAEQVRILYGFDRDTCKPVYSRVFPGRTNDKAAFQAAVVELNLGGNTIIVDMGFFDKEMFSFLEGINADYIIPLPENDTDLKAYDKRELSLGLKHWFQYRRRNIYYDKIEYPKVPGAIMYVFFDSSMRFIQLSNYCKKHRIDDSMKLDQETEDKMRSDSESFGFSFIISSKDKSPQDVFLDYKARWHIEEMFDRMKNVIGIDMTYETDFSKIDGWGFIDFISSLMFFSLDSKLRATDLKMKYNVKDLFIIGDSVRRCRLGDSSDWQNVNLTRNIVSLYKSLGVSFDLS